MKKLLLFAIGCSLLMSTDLEAWRGHRGRGGRWHGGGWGYSYDPFWVGAGVLGAAAIVGASANAAEANARANRAEVDAVRAQVAAEEIIAKRRQNDDGRTEKRVRRINRKLMRLEEHEKQLEAQIAKLEDLPKSGASNSILSKLHEQLDDVSDKIVDLENQLSH